VKGGEERGETGREGSCVPAETAS